MDLVEQIAAYHRRFGHDPASYHADHIYRTRENRCYCHSKGIRLSGAPLATLEGQGDHRQAGEARPATGQDDATTRVAVEGKLGQGKRRFGLGRLMAKRAFTSAAMLQVSFLVMNLEHTSLP